MINHVQVSVITYKRPLGLATLLDSLSKQKTDNGITVEICVVDNGGSNDTQGVIDKFQGKPYKIALLAESRRGIVFARNRAVDYFLDNQDADALIFIDDDEWTKDDRWIDNLVKAQKQTHIPIVTSDVISIPEDGNIAWTKNAMGRGKKMGDLSPIKRFYTGNVLVIRQVLENIRPAFDERFAMTGSSDLHFAMRCAQKGFGAIYTDKAPVYETFPKTRANMKWFFMRGFRSGSGATRSQMYLCGDHKTREAALCLLMACARFTKACYVLLMAILYRDKGRLANAIMRFGASIGTFLGLLGIKYEEYKTIHGK